MKSLFSPNVINNQKYVNKVFIENPRKLNERSQPVYPGGGQSIQDTPIPPSPGIFSLQFNNVFS